MTQRSSSRTLLVALGLLFAAAARAKAASLVVEKGQVLGEIATRTGCSVKELQRANNLRSTTIYTGQRLKLPRCGPKAEKKVAKQTRKPVVRDRSPTRGQSIGKPWHGRLRRPLRLTRGPGYFIRRPARAYGTTQAVRTIETAIRAARRRFPSVHTLAIGDLSARSGGSITEHASHQSGRDVDIGFYYQRKPRGYPASFIGFQQAPLDLAATWALLQAFLKTADSPTGVKFIFLDWRIQKELYDWARAHDVSKAYLDRVFQYPDGIGLVQHVANHHDHFHVRFKCPTRDRGCRD